MLPLLLAALLYSVIAVYEDGSCLEVTFEAERNCRVGAPIVWCPPGAAPCQAAQAAANLSAPTCAMLDATPSTPRAPRTQTAD